jgi:hypothetical protein
MLEQIGHVRLSACTSETAEEIRTKFDATSLHQSVLMEVKLVQINEVEIENYRLYYKVFAQNKSGMEYRSH